MKLRCPRSIYCYSQVYTYLFRKFRGLHTFWANFDSHPVWDVQIIKRYCNLTLPTVYSKRHENSCCATSTPSHAVLLHARKSRDARRFKICDSGSRASNSEILAFGCNRMLHGPKPFVIVLIIRSTDDHAGCHVFRRTVFTA